MLVPSKHVYTHDMNSIYTVMCALNPGPYSILRKQLVYNIHISHSDQNQNCLKEMNTFLVCDLHPTYHSGAHTQSLPHTQETKQQIHCLFSFFRVDVQIQLAQFYFQHDVIQDGSGCSSKCNCKLSLQNGALNLCSQLFTVRGHIMNKIKIGCEFA